MAPAMPALKASFSLAWPAPRDRSQMRTSPALSQVASACPSRE